MRILVTGCAGLIGWKVSELLLEEGHTVAGVDNLNHAYDVRLKEWRLSQLQAQPQFNFHKLDITEPQTLAQLFQQGAFDGVINLAARAGVGQSLVDPRAYYKTNVEGTVNLLELCQASGIKKFILASTSSVYGEGERPFREDAATDRPLSPYAASKKAAEEFCYVYHHVYGLDVTVLRYFTVYGPAGRPDMSIFRFIRWIAEGEPVVVYGDGMHERDFTYVSDIARGTVAALRPMGYQVVNLGSNSPTSLVRVIAILEELLGNQAQVQHQSSYSWDIRATWADISRGKSLLGWEPQISLETGLEHAVRWYQKNQSWVKEVPLP